MHTLYNTIHPSCFVLNSIAIYQSVPTFSLGRHTNQFTCLYFMFPGAELARTYMYSIKKMRGFPISAVIKHEDIKPVSVRHMGQFPLEQEMQVAAFVRRFRDGVGDIARLSLVFGQTE